MALLLESLVAGIILVCALSLQVSQSEQKILLRAIFDTLVPKLVAQDKPLMLGFRCRLFWSFDLCRGYQYNPKAVLKRSSIFFHEETSQVRMQSLISGVFPGADVGIVDNQILQEECGTQWGEV